MNDMISGVWVNRNTGEKITVLNTIIDGDNMILMTTGGQITMDEFSMNYIQASDDIYDESGNVIDHKPLDVNEIITTDNQTNNIFLSNKVVSSTKKEKQTSKKIEEPEEYKVLDKFFNKLDNKLDLITLDIDFEKLPIDKLKTLIEYLDIDTEIIARYISEKLVNIEALKNIILNKVQQYL